MRYVGVCICAMVFCGAWAQAADVTVPRVLDKRLKIELFAAEPQIVTPTGIALDAKGRVLVIESHTHFRPKDYQGPATDRIRMFEDTDGDGRADRVTTFFDGTRHTMNLAVYRDGSVFVAKRDEVFRLFDTDGDGKSDRRVSIAKLDTAGDYPHNGLSGFAFDAAGNVYFGLGENLGADYRLVGSDGRTLSGGGEGGNIYRCRADGSCLEQMATGFWNPFHLCLDAYDRLFAVDNDPDWRPPCRLLHIVPGGDYGYRFRNGRRGLHPFTSWFGHLPGTLPLVAGTGEAPSGVLAYESDNLPADYRGDLLATSWGFHAIQRYRMKPRGATFQSAAETIIKGDHEFRPVGMALAPDGSLYVSDWVDPSYNVHGKGRIWRISAVKGPTPSCGDDPRKAIHSPHGPLRRRAARRLAAQGDESRRHLHHLATTAEDPKVRAAALSALAAAGGLNAATAQAALRDTSADVRALAVRLAPDKNLRPAKIAAADKSALVRAAALRRLRSRDGLVVVLRAAADADPFVRQAAREAMRRTTDTATWLASGLPKQADARLAVALVLRGRGEPAAETILPKLLADTDSRVRFVAVQWVGEAKLNRFRPQLIAGLQGGAEGGELFAAYLAALDLLDGGQGAAFESRQADLVAGLLEQSDLSAGSLVQALRRLPADHKVLSVGRFKSLLEHPDANVQIEAVRSLRGSRHAQRGEMLARLAADDDKPTTLRAEAIAALSPTDATSRKVLLRLANGPNATLRREALRSLRNSELTDPERASLKAAGRASPQDAELVARVLDPRREQDRPPADDVDAWMKRLAGNADPAAGARIFFHERAARCFVCHRVDGRGGEVGPDLSTAGNYGRRRLVESILLPSREIAPQYVPWSLVMDDGTLLTAVLVSEQGENQLYADATGKLIRLERKTIVDRKPQPISIMPDGLAAQLTDQELRDLLAFLAQRR